MEVFYQKYFYLLKYIVFYIQGKVKEIAMTIQQVFFYDWKDGLKRQLVYFLFVILGKKYFNKIRVRFKGESFYFDISRGRIIRKIVITIKFVIPV